MTVDGPATRLVPDSAALYEWECAQVLHRVDQDLGYWQELAQNGGGPVLELAAALADAGLRPHHTIAMGPTIRVVAGPGRDR